MSGRKGQGGGDAKADINCRLDREIACLNYKPLIHIFGIVTGSPVVRGEKGN
jgi:hypothetical protein